MGPQFNHSLLLLARQYRQRSQKQVAAKARLTQGHYSRIENGLLPDGPSSENVEKIAAVLEFPASFFYLNDGLSGLPLSVHPMTRRKASVGERALKQLHANLNLRLIHIRRLLEAVEVDPELPLVKIDVDEAGGPAAVAQLIRQVWHLPPGPIDNLTEAAERAGILVIWCDLVSGIDGVTMWVRDIPPCIFLNRNAPADRMRASLAHEIGHVVMHQIPTDEIEDEANAFAAELLAPQSEMTREFIGRLTLEKLARMKAYWRVSMQFLLYRAHALGCITKNQSQYLWKQISWHGWRTREPEETEFAHEKPNLFPHVVKLHSEDLKYEIEDFVRLLHTNPNDLRYFYDLVTSDHSVHHLRIIK